MNSNQRTLSLDALLLMVLVISTINMNPDNLAGWREAYPWTQYLLPASPHLIPMGDPLKPLYNVLKITLLIAYLILDIINFAREKGRQWTFRGKTLILSLLVFITTVAPALNLIAARHHIGPSAYAHDGAVVQVEEAVKFLIKGKNPYSVTYENTPVRDAVNPVIWQKYGLKENPILYHFPYPPFAILSALPFYALSEGLFGWYDQRFLYLLAFIALMILAVNLTESRSAKLSMAALLSLNPLTAVAMKEGMNDLFLIFWIVLMIHFLKSEKKLAAALILAIACGIKQMAWVLVPFFFLHVHGERNFSLQNIKKTLMSRETAGFALLFLLLFLPFLIWDFKAFTNDLLSYHAGRTLHPYPIRGDSGYGFSNLLVHFGAVNSVTEYFPFTIIQVLFAFPLLYALLYKQVKSNTLEQMLTGYALMLLVFLFFGRYFAANYIGFILSLLTIAFFMSWRKTEKPGNRYDLQ